RPCPRWPRRPSCAASPTCRRARLLPLPVHPVPCGCAFLLLLDEVSRRLDELRRAVGREGRGAGGGDAVELVGLVRVERAEQRTDADVLALRLLTDHERERQAHEVVLTVAGQVLGTRDRGSADPPADRGGLGGLAPPGP